MEVPGSVPVEGSGQRVAVARAAVVAPFVAGILISGGLIAVALRGPRDTAGPAVVAIVGGLVAAQIAVVTLHRLHDGRDGRVGFVAASAAVGGPPLIALGIVLTGLKAADIAWVVAGLGLLAMLVSWIAFGFGIAGAGVLRPLAGQALLWSVIALFLFQPWDIRVLFGLPFGLSWLLIGFEARRLQVAGRHDGTTSRPPHALRAVTAVLVGGALVAVVVLGLGRVTARSVGVPGAGPTTPLTVVIDTDSQSDDWMAIAYLLARPDVTIAGIAVTGTGPLGCDGGVLQVLRLMALAGRNDIPVACGRRTPLAGDRAFPTEFASGLLDLVRNVPLPKAVGRASDLTGVELLRTAIDDASGHVTLLALGPLTNVAEAFAADPTLAARLDRLVIMGGAVDVTGNVEAADAQSVEYNFFVDAAAADRVLRSGARITLVPLDATGDVPVTLGVVERMRAGATTALKTYVADLLHAQHDFIATGTFQFWDPLAAVIATDGRVAGFESRSLVVSGDGPDSGRTMATPAGSLVTMAVSADAAAFERTFIASLAGATP